MREKMVKIAFVLPASALPVPAVKGGAIETLMTMLLEENEKSGCFRFVFISPDSTDAVNEWNYAVCYTCSIKKEECVPEIAGIYGKKSRDVLELYPYDYKAGLITEYEKADYVIMEGAASRIRGCFENTVDIGRRAVHLHHQFERSGIYKEAFGVTIAPSYFISSSWNKQSPENGNRTYVLHNGIQTERFSVWLEQAQRDKKRDSLGIAEDDFIVLFCGRFIPEKGVKELIAAVLSIPQENVKLLLIGSANFADGSQTSYAREVIQAAEENKRRIIYLGYIANQLLADYYQCADMQAVPSLCEEAAGLVALEGMSSRLPLLVTRSGGMTEYVTEGAGLVIDKDEHIMEHLAEGILWMKDHPFERKTMSCLAQKQAEQYSSQNYYRSFLNMMDWWQRLDTPDSR